MLKATHTSVISHGKNRNIVSEWTPATKDEVQRWVQSDADEYDIGPWRHMLIDPIKRGIKRFGSVEDVFVVARGPNRVVFFEDIEDLFATATEVGQMLEDCHYYGPLIVALKEAAAGE